MKFAIFAIFLISVQVVLATSQALAATTPSLEERKSIAILNCEAVVSTASIDAVSNGLGITDESESPDFNLIVKLESQAYSRIQMAEIAHKESIRQLCDSLVEAAVK